MRCQVMNDKFFHLSKWFLKNNKYSEIIIIAQFFHQLREHFLGANVN